MTSALVPATGLAVQQSPNTYLGKVATHLGPAAGDSHYSDVLCGLLSRGAASTMTAG
jgi:hypothetical protein